MSKQRYLFLPGGGVEPNEPPAVAAVRETLEETGYHIEVVGPPLVLAYQFIWNGKPWDCLTSFFRGSSSTPLSSPPKRWMTIQTSTASSGRLSTKSTLFSAITTRFLKPSES